MIKHTPTPLGIKDGYKIYDALGGLIAETCGMNYEKVAAHIVKCVNNYELFVSALNAIIGASSLNDAREYASEALRQVQE